MGKLSFLLSSVLLSFSPTLGEAKCQGLNVDVIVDKTVIDATIIDATIIDATIIDVTVRPMIARPATVHLLMRRK